MAQPLLEPVAAGQTRFRMQGLAPDARGIAVGRELLLVFPSMDRLVAFLGAYSEEASLDDLVPTMTLERARREGGGHGFLLRCAAGDAYAVERVARIAGATQGQVFTGSSRTFVRWRQRIAPFGYDLVEPIVGGSEDVIAVDLEYASRYQTLERLDPVELVQRLHLRAIPLPLRGIAGDPDLCGLKELALVLIAPGLKRRVLRYLWELEIPVAGYACLLEGDRQPSLLLRLRQPKGRILDVLHGTPGVELLVPTSPRAAVEVGYRHPIHLPSAVNCFPGDEMFLFRGRAGRVERLEGPPRFIDGRHLVAHSDDLNLREPSSVSEQALEPLRIRLRLRTTSSPAEPRAVVVDWERAGLLRRLVYLLPPSSLATARVVLLEQGLVILTASLVAARNPISALGLSAGALAPLGRRLSEAAPGVFVPNGQELWPRVRPHLLRQLLGLDVDDHALFLDQDNPPIRVRASQLLSLDAALIGRLDLEDQTTITPEHAALKPARIENQRVGRFALWGFGGAKPPRAGEHGSEG